MRKIASVSIRTIALLKKCIAWLSFIRVFINIASQLSYAMSKLAFVSIGTMARLCPFFAKGSFNFIL